MLDLSMFNLLYHMNICMYIYETAFYHKEYCPNRAMKLTWKMPIQ
jgi:hypothetical protein